MLSYSERGPVGPDTQRTIRLLRDEWRARMGLPPSPEPEAADLEALITLRSKWADRPGEEH